MGVRGRVYQKHSSKNITARPQFYQFISVYIGMIDNQYHSYPSRVVISFSMEASGSSFMSNMSFLQHLPCRSGDPFTTAEEQWEQVFQSDKETNRQVRRSSYNQIFTSPLKKIFRARFHWAIAPTRGVQASLGRQRSIPV